MALCVRDYMSTALVTVRSDADIVHAVHLMIEHGLSGLPVLDGAGMLAGIVTERDCIEVALQSSYFDEWGGAVAEFMSAPVVTVGPGDHLVDVAEKLAHSRYRRFPVVEAQRLVGLISRRDVLRALQNEKLRAGSTDARNGL
jgi:CBS domain-containing protein